MVTDEAAAVLLMMYGTMGGILVLVHASTVRAPCCTSTYYTAGGRTDAEFTSGVQVQVPLTVRYEYLPGR